MNCCSNTSFVKRPNEHCPRLRECLKNERYWMICKLRKEFISEGIERERLKRLREGIVK